MYDLISNLGSALDNVYNSNVDSVSPRKTVAKLCDDKTMKITFITIFNSSRQNDLHLQMNALKKEADEMIKNRLKEIKQEFKSLAKRNLNTKKINTSDYVETLTVSPYSPFRQLKLNLTYTYEVK